jgi:alkylation response protein AidB-like acyl-CoA dehydrogenase
VAAGEILPVAAWQEGLGGIDPLAPGTEAVEDGPGFRLDGSKRFVANGLGADGFVVSARTGAGVGLYWVPKNSAGVVYEPQRRADGTESGALCLAGVRVGKTDVIATAGKGGDALVRALDEALVVVSAELAGIAARALEITLDYLRTRVQFGKPIGSFQALQHRCVDLYIQKELCRSALGVAVRTLDGPAAAVERSLCASRVKARCSDAAVEIARKSIQMHGAIGFTDECDIGLYLKRALVQSAWLGNGTAHRRRYAALAVRA